MTTSSGKQESYSSGDSSQPQPIAKNSNPSQGWSKFQDSIRAQYELFEKQNSANQVVSASPLVSKIYLPFSLGKHLIKVNYSSDGFPGKLKNQIMDDMVKGFRNEKTYLWAVSKYLVESLEVDGQGVWSCEIKPLDLQPGSYCSSKLYISLKFPYQGREYEAYLAKIMPAH